MATFEQLPARLDIRASLDDVVTLTVEVSDGDGTPVPVGGWTLSGVGVEVDGAGSTVTLEVDTAKAGVSSWRLVREAPSRRTLVGGTLSVSRSSAVASPPSGSEIVLQLVDAEGEVGLSIVGGSAGGGGSLQVRADGEPAGEVSTVDFVGAEVSVSAGVATVSGLRGDDGFGRVRLRVYVFSNRLFVWMNGQPTISDTTVPSDNHAVTGTATRHGIYHTNRVESRYDNLTIAKVVL